METKCPTCNGTGMNAGLKSIDACKTCTERAEAAYQAERENK